MQMTEMNEFQGLSFLSGSRRAELFGFGEG